MKRRFAAFLLAVGVLVPILSSLSFAQVPRVRVGVVIDGPWQRNDEISENTRSSSRSGSLRLPKNKLSCATHFRSASLV